MPLFPRHSECQTQDFLGFGHGLFVQSPGCDRVLLSTSRGGGGVKLQRRYVAFGRSDLTVSYLHRQSLILRFNYAKSKAWLFSETEIVNSKHVNSEYAIYY